MFTAFGFVSEKVNKDVPFWAMATGANDFTTLGAACTTRVAMLLGVPGVGNPA